MTYDKTDDNKNEKCNRIFLDEKLSSDKTGDSKEGAIMTAQEIITVEEMAVLLRIKAKTLYDNRWRAQSRCPLFRQGKRLFSYRKEFERWYKARLQYV